MRILLIFLFSVFTIIASAQQYTVAGKCTDNRGVPVDGAKIILEALLKTFAGKTYASVDPSNGFYPHKTL